MKRILKQILYALFRVLTFPAYALYLGQSLFFGREASFYDWSQLMSLFPGTPGNYLRFGFYAWVLPRLGEDACICFGSTLSHPDIEIGKGIYIGPFCNLGLCSIGDDTLLGTGVYVISGFNQHNHADLDKPMREQGGTLLKVAIGSDCWIGNKTVVGAHVGSKCIIGAASLVVRELPEFSVAVGNPAEVIRDRRTNAKESRPLASST